MKKGDKIMRPTIVEIQQSEDGLLDGQVVRVKDLRVDNGEVDYRIVTNGGEEFWIPSENSVIIQ